MSNAFRMPDLGEGIATAEVMTWLVAQGDTIAEDDPLLEVQTDKAIMEIPSPFGGVVLDILVEAGSIVTVGTPLVVIGDPAKASVPLREQPLRIPVALDSNGACAARVGPETPGRVERLTGLRRLAAEHVERAHREIPAVTIVDECDFSDVPRNGISHLPPILQAAASTLGDYPQLNATIRDGELRLHDRIDIGVAVQTDYGLVVPVIRDADTLTVAELGDQVRTLTNAARDRTLRPEQLGSSTFSVTAAGRRGGLFATPLINHPEVAILGVHRITSRPIVRRGQVVVARVGYLSFTFDHRAIDGLAAGGFLQRVIRRIVASATAAERR